jgi:4-amino-4-deoxy-L-arabinose transferase-like glycosyltransferase
MSNALRVSGLRSQWPVYVILAALIYMPIFGNLNVLPIREWDEGRNAVNAFEMYKSGNYLVTTFNYEPDMWNTKPPLLTWLQALLIRLAGADEIAIRLPSAVAAFFTCLALLWFSRKHLHSLSIAVISVLTLVTTNGYIHYHVSRTGDFDALLTLWTTVSCLVFYLFCETGRHRFLYAFFVSLALAVLTKGVAGLMFTPAIALWCILRRKLPALLRSAHFYAGLVILLALTLGFYLLRESQNQGYIAQVQANELGGRYLTTQNENPTDFFFYLRSLSERQMPEMFLVIPCGMIFGCFSRHENLRRFSLFTTICVVSFFLIISASQTRMEQYIAPLFPFFAISVAIALYHVFLMLRDASWFNRSLRRNIVPYLFLFLVFAVPYQRIWAKTYAPKEDYHWDNDFYELSNVLKEARGGHYYLHNKSVVYDGYDAHLKYYAYALADRGINCDMKHITWIKAGDQVVASQPHIKESIRKKFDCREENLRRTVWSFTIVGKADTISRKKKSHPKKNEDRQ